MKKIKNSSKISNVVICSLCFLILVVLFIIWLFNYHVISYQDGNPNEVPIVIEINKKIKKTLKVKYNNFQSISLRFGTYENNDLKGIIHIELHDQKNKIFDEKIDMSSLRDNEFYEIKFDKQKKSKNKQYTLFVYSEDIKKNNEVAIWGYYNENGIFIDNDKQEMDIAVMYKYNSHDYSVLIYFPISIAIIGLILLFRKEN